MKVIWYEIMMNELWINTMKKLKYYRRINFIYLWILLMWPTPYLNTAQYEYPTKEWWHDTAGLIEEEKPSGTLNIKDHPDKFNFSGRG